MTDVIDIKDRRKGKRTLPEKPRTLPALQDGKHPAAPEPEPTGKLAAAKRRSEVLALAFAGADPPRIAEVLTERYTKKGWRPIKTTTVQRIVNEALTEMQEADSSTIEQVRTLQLARLDDLLQKLYPKVTKEGVNESTRLRIVDRILRIEKLRARIAGTEAPRKVEGSLKLSLDVDQEEVDRDEQAWLNSGGDVIDLPDSAITEITGGE